MPPRASRATPLTSARLAEAELADKADRSINARISRARFPMLRTLEGFDFSFQPGLQAARVRELASLSFLDQAANVLLVGGPGVGKTQPRSSSNGQSRLEARRRRVEAHGRSEDQLCVRRVLIQGHSYRQRGRRKEGTLIEQPANTV